MQRRTWLRRTQVAARRLVAANGRGRLWAAAAVALVMAAGACNKKDTPQALEIPSAARELAPSAPFVRVTRESIELDGKPVGSPRAIEDLGRLQKVDELSNGLEALRKQRGDAFVGQAILELPSESSALLFKSVFMTIAHAGYPHLVVRTGGDSFVAVEAQLPTVPIFGAQPAEREVDLRAQGDEGSVFVRREDGKIVEEWKWPSVPPKQLVGQLREWLAKYPPSGPAPRIVVHCDNQVRIKRIHELFDTLNQVRSKLPPGDGAQHAFEIGMGAK